MYIYIYQNHNIICCAHTWRKDGNGWQSCESHGICWCFVRDCPSPAPVPSVSMVSLHGGFHCLRRVPTTQSVSILLTNIDNQRKIAKSEAH